MGLRLGTSPQLSHHARFLGIKEFSLGLCCCSPASPQSSSTAVCSTSDISPPAPAAAVRNAAGTWDADGAEQPQLFPTPAIQHLDSPRRKHPPLLKMDREGLPASIPFGGTCSSGACEMGDANLRDHVGCQAGRAEGRSTSITYMPVMDAAASCIPGKAPHQGLSTTQGKGTTALWVGKCFVTEGLFPSATAAWAWLWVLKVHQDFGACSPSQCLQEGLGCLAQLVARNIRQLGSRAEIHIKDQIKNIWRLRAKLMA